MINLKFVSKVPCKFCEHNFSNGKCKMNFQTMTVVKPDFFIFINEIHALLLIIEIKICMWIRDENTCVCKLNPRTSPANLVLPKEGTCSMHKAVSRDWDPVQGDNKGLVVTHNLPYHTEFISDLTVSQTLCNSIFLNSEVILYKNSET